MAMGQSPLPAPEEPDQCFLISEQILCPTSNGFLGNQKDSHIQQQQLQCQAMPSSIEIEMVLIPIHTLLHLSYSIEIDTTAGMFGDELHRRREVGCFLSVPLPHMHSSIR